MNQQNQPQDLNLKKMLPIAIIVGIVLVLIIFGSKMTYTIDAGHRGIIFSTFGGGIKMDQEAKGEGFHFIAPWDKVIVYSIQQSEKEEQMNVLSSNGLQIQLEVSAWFKPLESELALLHTMIGKNYEEKVIIPALRSAARSVIGRYTPEEIYSTKRDAIQNEIFAETKKILDTKYTFLDRILIRSVVLPDKIKDAIQAKLKQEQLSQGYKYKIEKEAKEAERKRIAAEGEAKANQIINSSLTPSLLKMRGIEATVKLSESTNSKVVIIGSGKDGMPLILGNDK